MSIRTATLRLQLVDDVSGKAGLISKSLQGMNKTIGGLDQSIARTRGQFFGAVGMAAAAAAAFVAPVRAAIDFESAMADVRKVVDFETPEAFRAMSDQVLELSKRLPMTAQGIAAIVAAAGQSGIAKDQLIGFAEVAAKVATAWDVSADESGEALSKLMASLGMNVAQAALLADALNHLSNNTAASAPDLLNFTRRVAPLAGTFGLSAQQASAFGAAMIGAGFEAEVAATSFQNMGKALTVGSGATKSQRAAFKALGLDAKKIQKDMQVDAAGTIQVVMEKLRALPKELQAATMFDLFGSEAKALIPLITNAELLAKALELVEKEADYAGSAQREFAERSTTTANALQLLRNRVMALAIAFGEIFLPAVNQAVDALGPWLAGLTQWVKANPALIKGVTAAAAGLLGLRVALLGGKLLALIFARDVLKAGRALLKFAAWSKTAAGSAIALQTALGAASGQKLGLWAKLWTGIKGVAVATPGLGLLVKGLTAVGAALAAISAPVWGLIAAAALAAAAAGAALYRHWDVVSSIFQGVGRALGEQLAPAFEAIRPALDWLAPLGSAIAAGWSAATSVIGSFATWIGSFFSRNHLDEGQKAAWESYGHDLTNGLINGVKSGLAALPGVVVGIPRALYAAVGMEGLFDAGARLAGDLARGVGSGLSSLASAASGAVSQLVAAFRAGNLYATGVAMIQSLLDGAKAKVAELLVWVAGIPGAIRSAIGNIDLSNIISWPSRPSWLGGGGGSAKPEGAPSSGGSSAPAVDGARAHGGPVSAGKLYLVGERGPELFSPSSNGSVVPNSQTPRHLGGSAPVTPPMEMPASTAVGAAPAEGVAAAPAPVTISVGAPQVHLTVHGLSDENMVRRIRKAVDDGLNQALGSTLDKMLRRSAQTAFRSLRYGEA